MTEITEGFVEERVEEIRNRQDVEAIGVVGSYARDPDRDHNDLDLFIIIEGEWRKRVTERIDGVVVEKFFNSFRHSERYLEKDDEWWKNYHWYRNVDVRYDPDDLFERLSEKAEEARDERLGEVKEDELLYFIWDMKQDLDTEDVGQKRFLMYNLFDYLVEKTYIMKEVVPVKKNYRIEKLQNFDGYMYKLAQDFLNSSSTHEKERKLDKMIEHLTRGAGEPSPEWKTEREEFEDS